MKRRKKNDILETQLNDPIYGDCRRILLSHMKKYKLGYNQVGRLSGVSPAVIYRFATGERDILCSTFERIASALGMKVVTTEIFDKAIKEHLDTGKIEYKIRPRTIRELLDNDNSKLFQ